LVDDDFEANIQQKGVDIKIGLDVAWISQHNAINRIILLSADTDFVPAMKLARRQGVQITLIEAYRTNASLIGEELSPLLLEHAVFIRKIKYINNVTKKWELV
jgi:uncharacterized LabA/DUF88 family protein